MKKQIPFLYLCIHQRLRQGFEREIPDTKKVLEIIRMIYRVQKRYAAVVLKEMENFGLVKVISWNKNGKVEIFNTNIDLENTSQLYKMVGLH